MSEIKMTGNDDRLKKSGAVATRGDRVEGDAPRTQQDGTALTQEDRMRMIRSEWDQNILPEVPKAPGWHYCWLSTTNSTDPIYKRIQRGYEPVRASDVQGFAQYKLTQGEFEGCVACNEMLLFRISEEMYQAVMSYFHYEKPMGEEEMLKANAEGNEQDSNGRKLREVEGFETLARNVRPTSFS